MNSSMVNIGVNFRCASFGMNRVIITQICFYSLMYEYLHVDSNRPISTDDYICTNTNMRRHIAIGIIDQAITSIIGHILSHLPLGMIHNDVYWRFNFGFGAGLGTSIKACRNKKECKKFHVLLTYPLKDVTA